MEPQDDGRPRPTETPADHRVVHIGRFEPTVCVQRPYAYLIPPGLEAVIENLHRHGIRTEPYEGRARIDTYTVTRIARAEREFQGRRVNA